MALSGDLSIFFFLTLSRQNQNQKVNRVRPKNQVEKRAKAQNQKKAKENNLAKMEKIKRNLT